MADDRKRNLDVAISQIEKEYGKGAIMRLGDKDALVPVAVIPTGALSLDVALGMGGLPRGRPRSSLLRLGRIHHHNRYARSGRSRPAGRPWIHRPCPPPLPPMTS